MGDIDNVFKVLANNTADVETIVRQFGGIGNVIRAAPAMLRIMRTVSAAKDPVEEVNRVEHVIYYNEATKERVKSFQEKHGLQADGLVGNATWKKVEELIKGGK